MPIVTVIYQKKQFHIEIQKQTNLLNLLLQSQIPIQAPCGGHGGCGKCKVLLRDREKESEVLACRTFVDHNCIVEIPPSSLLLSSISEDYETSHASDFSNQTHRYGAAVDLGSTTVVVSLISLDSEMVIGTKKEWNVQISYGSDVISRLKYIQDHADGLFHLSNLIQEQILRMINEICEKTDISFKNIEKMVLSGNTIMQHIFAGIDPSPIATAPYIPKTFFCEDKFYQLGLFPNMKIRFLPCISGFVGGDVTSGLLASELYKKDGTYLFLDVGTNGEMAIGGKNGFLTCSVASGPAFEGAEITCGMTSSPGAINHIEWKENQCKFHLHTIDDAIPIGICGSGLIDLLAILLDIGLLDETGRLLSEKEAKAKLSRITLARLKHSLGYHFLEDDTNGNGIFYLKRSPNIFLTLSDVRKIQLAKAAIAAGIRILLKASGKHLSEIDGLYIAGGFGKSLNAENATKIGMIPSELTDRITCIGNSSLAGAAKLLFDEELPQTAMEIVRNCEYIELSGNPAFSDEFIKQMNL
ncbi:MAG: ASKHA domain-containing protein [Lachnospiraceae bacterium]|nr:ASKHA domain-containing protein [Lachnospiraceae bacterium]